MCEKKSANSGENCSMVLPACMDIVFSCVLLRESVEGSKEASLFASISLQIPWAKSTQTDIYIYTDTKDVGRQRSCEKSGYQK